jgi:hypothetical protein
MPDVCAVVSAATDDMAQTETFFKYQVINAITYLIGRPTKSLMRKAQAAYKKNPSTTNKKKYDLETARYIEHKKLRDQMIAYTMKTGKEANYNLHLANPEEITNSWRSIFARRLRGEINPMTIMQGSRKIKALRTLVNRVENKREQLVKKDKLQKTAIFLSPPEIIVSHFDKFGFLGQLVEKILTMGDRNIQESSRFLDPITNARNDLTNNLESLIKDSISGFNITASSMGGITGLHSNTYGAVTIHERRETVDEGIVYVVTLDDANDGVRKYLPEDDLETNKQGVDARVVQMYRDELMDELGNGQTRLIVPQLLENASESDMRKVRRILDVAYREKEREDAGQKVPGMHSIRVDVYDEELGYTTPWEYTYIMIKQGEGEHEIDGEIKAETYNAYLVNKKQELSGVNKFGDKINFLGKTRQLTEEEEIIDIQYSYNQVELDDVMKRGFYRAERNENFGKHTYKDKKSIVLADGTAKDIDTETPVYLDEEVKGSAKKNWVDFQYMEKQPHEKAMDMIWTAMAKIRDSYADAYRDLRIKNQASMEKRANLNQTIINWRIKGMGDSPDDAAIWLSDQLKKVGINEYIRVNDDGRVVTSTTYAKDKKENYFPQMYHRENIFVVQIPAAINELKEKIEEYEDNNGVSKKDLKEAGEYEGSRLENLNEGLAHLSKMLEDYNKGLDVDMGSLNDLNALKSMKHITSWTNPMMRRKDGGVHQDYFEQSYNTLHKNEIMIELMNAIYKMTRVDKNIPQGSLDYIINRVKIGFGDPTSRAMTITGKETSYEKSSETLNGLPSWVLGGVVHDARSAERLTKWLTAPASMMFLGGSSALGNSAQIVNQIMRVGWKIAGEAYSRYQGNPDEYKKIIRNTGILNVMTMFTDIMLKDGSSKWNDAGLVNAAGVPIPTINVIKFCRLLLAGRENFVENGTDEIDNFLYQLIKASGGETREEIIRLRTINELRKGIGDTELRKKRGQLYDVFTLKENESKAVVEKAFRELLTKVADTKLKQMVSWKLSWWFDEAGGPGKDLFTFTESENRLRTLTAIMGLIHAEKTGLLGGSDNWKKNWQSPLAVRIARNAVYYTQFGMTPPYLGEGFNGFGRALWQYKQYPTLQMIHDGQVMLTFMDGNYGMGDGFGRIVKAVSYSTSNFWKKGKTYDPADPDIDHEAIMMARWIGTRGIASVLASTIGSIPFLGQGIRALAPTLPIYSLFRGAENPMIGLAMRSIVWSSMFMMGLDDEDERNDMTNSIGFFFLPVLLGMMIRGVYGAYESFED